MDRQRRLLRAAIAVLAAFAAVAMAAAPAQAQGAAAYTIEAEDVTGLVPGGTAPATLKFVNSGTAAPEHGIIVQFVSEYLVTTGDYANCGYKYCVFPDFAPEPGVVYELPADTPLTVSVDADFPGPMPMLNIVRFADLEAGAMDALDLNDAETELAFQVSEDQDVEEHATMVVTTAEHPYDIEAHDETVTGDAGGQAVMHLDYTNLGPADAIAYEHPTNAERHFMIAVQLPDGLKVASQGPGVPPGVWDIDYDNYCESFPEYQDPAPDPAIYGLERVDFLCFAPGILDPGETVSLAIDVVIAADAVTNDGAISILEQAQTWEEVPYENIGQTLPEYPVIEQEFANNTADLRLEVTGTAPGTGGGKLPETGGSLAAAGLAGAGAITAGAVLLALLRRRTLRNL
ncbi:hypothetical protein AB0A73_28345 [Glycomyces sp. NPDC047369]